MAQTVPAIYIQEGIEIDYTPVSATAAGTVVVQNDLLGITLHPIAANQLGAIRISGVFDVPKKAEAFAVGVVAYWDATAGQATATSSYAPPVLGITVAAALSGDATVRVRLLPGMLHDV